MVGVSIYIEWFTKCFFLSLMSFARFCYIEKIPNLYPNISRSILLYESRRDCAGCIVEDREFFESKSFACTLEGCHNFTYSFEMINGSFVNYVW